MKQETNVFQCYSLKTELLFTLDTSKIDNDFYPDPNIRNGVITKDTVLPETIVNYEKI